MKKIVALVLALVMMLSCVSAMAAVVSLLTSVAGLPELKSGQ